VTPVPHISNDSVCPRPTVINNDLQFTTVTQKPTLKHEIKLTNAKLDHLTQRG